MDFKQIQELIKTINKSNIGELCIEEKDFKICIKQKEDPAPVYTQAAPAITPVAISAAPVAAALPVASTPASVEDNSDKYITIKSPMIGTFYRKSAPEKPNLVDEGADVTVGKVVCVIEAMKLFNEIESEVSGKIVKVLVDDASPVEYDQPLFLVEP
ncbi:acetyl-CoA carboxylase biotin carboxyl carrier protein [Rhizosphaericola mali]|uniref:Biotin carboxyl carrier protein of acetyl-CoA carboxylase n=1 Tax=Rhizosphaericola mali TaxID=2545455 RepID=A0A5P2G2J5_9BACT|nr:acetyl-CoA carboxylase biotin carboxyl carrier protein [Rhizosphaericola mali]QES90034.1 acetyl-CoA carboxylase biotin carboxyl carrier protein [Rhizosphaericola mali]